MESLNNSNKKKMPRRFKMFKKRIKQLDIYEEAEKRHQRVWNTIDDK